MPTTLDYDSIPANALVWDFAMPPKSWSTLPLSSECLINEVFQVQAGKVEQPANRTNARMEECRVTNV
jgi:hypothetical protein